MPTTYGPEFIAALRLFARASEAMHARGFQRPILVGGAAAEFHTASALDHRRVDASRRLRLRHLHAAAA